LFCQASAPNQSAFAVVGKERADGHGLTGEKVAKENLQSFFKRTHSTQKNLPQTQVWI